MKKLKNKRVKEITIVKTVKKVKKYTFDDGLLFLGTSIYA